MSIHCECDSSSNCSCKGINYSCQCNSYSSGEAEQYPRPFIANQTKSGCPSLVYAPVNTYHQSDINTLYNVLENIEKGKNIIGNDISTLWDEFKDLLDVKQDYTYSGGRLPENYNKPTDIHEGKKIKVEHFSHLKSNIQRTHQNGKLSLIDNTGTGFDAPDGSRTRSINGTWLTNYQRGDVIMAEKVGLLAKWIGASMYHCVCNNNATTHCCTCDIVCDCNY